MRALDAHKRSKTSDAKFYKFLIDFIQLRKEIKQLSHKHVIRSQLNGIYALHSLPLFFRLLGKFSYTYALPFTLNLLWTATTMAVVLVSLQMEMVE